MKNLTERLDKHLQRLQESFDMATITPLVKKAISNEKILLHRKVQQAMLNCFKTGKFVYSRELEKALAEQVADSIDDIARKGNYSLEDAIYTLCYTDELQEGEINISLVEFETLMEKQNIPESFIDAWDEATDDLYHKVEGDPICKAVIPYLKKRFNPKEVDDAIEAYL